MTKKLILPSDMMEADSTPQEAEMDARPGVVIATTKTGNRIPIAEAKEFSSQEIARQATEYDKFSKELSSNSTLWRNRRTCDTTYNCVGMVWVSRRAVVTDMAACSTILKDDGYRLAGTSERPFPGDVILYVKTWHDTAGRERKEVLHVARVAWIVKGEGLDATVALSKWNDCFGEDLHRAEDPLQHYRKLSRETDRLDVQYWTDRPTDVQEVRRYERVYV